MSTPKLVQVIDSCSIWHNTAILASFVHEFLGILGVTAKPTPLPAFKKKTRFMFLSDHNGSLLRGPPSFLRLHMDSQPVSQYACGDSKPGGQQLGAESAQVLRLMQQCSMVFMS